MSVIVTGKLTITNDLVLKGDLIQVNTLELLKKHYPNYKEFREIHGKFDNLTIEKDLILCAESLGENKLGEIITLGTVTVNGTNYMISE